MNTSKFRMPLLMFVSALCMQQVTFAEDAVRHYSIKQSAPSVGTNITKEIVKAGTIPLNKPYADLSTEQKNALRAEYDHMPDSDEPPFPVKGLFAIYKAIANAHEALELQYMGAFNANVSVDSEGKPTSVDVIDSPDAGITNAATFVLMNIKYKPAQCSGQPCSMQMPIHAELVGPTDGFGLKPTTADSMIKRE